MIILALAGCAFTGLLVGSALWVLADQQIRAETLFGRPVCLDCGSAKSWSAWLPLFSLLGIGACRQCHISEGRDRTVWEVAVASYFGAAFVFVDLSDLAVVLVGSVPLLFILIVDVKCDAVFVGDCYVAILTGLALSFLEGPREAANAALGMAIAAAVTLLFLIVSRWLLRSMHLNVSPIGKSDVYIALGAGAVVGADAVLPALLLAVVGFGLASVLAPVFMTSKRGKAPSFGPFLLTGALLALII